MSSVAKTILAVLCLFEFSSKAFSQNNPNGYPNVGHTFTVIGPSSGKTYHWKLVSTTALPVTPITITVGNVGSVAATYASTGVTFTSIPKPNHTFTSVTHVVPTTTPVTPPVNFSMQPAIFPQEPVLGAYHSPVRLISANGQVKVNWTFTYGWYGSSGSNSENLPGMQQVRTEVWVVTQVDDPAP